MRKKLIAANWKMNKTRAEATDFTRVFAGKFSNSDCEITLFPPFTAIEAVAKEVDGKGMTVGAQDVFYENSGAYTGEVSCVMLADLGCAMVIAGHSERRHIFGESDELVAKKTHAVVRNGMGVLLCVGETDSQRIDGKEKDVVRQQLTSALKGVPPGLTTVAYEPVWAIGTGNNAKSGDIEEMHIFMRDVLGGIFGADSDGIKILYGGSINPGNASEIARVQGVDGMLVGTASLELESFVSIIEASLAD
ncbi:MAG: triose-phosphate isomerase [Candidatus Mycalebacterium zealandia]|nr:MAG: triose-phosphate isomerase [Candidatus Mycalebacterium zealandia]